MGNGRCTLFYPQKTDPKLVRTLRNAIVSAGFDLYDWRVTMRDQGGGVVLSNVTNTILNSKRIVLVLSDNEDSVSSNVFYELGYSHCHLGQDKVVPIIAEDLAEVPYYLNILSFLTFGELDEPSLQQLRESVRQRLQVPTDIEKVERVLPGLLTLVRERKDLLPHVLFDRLDTTTAAVREAVSTRSRHDPAGARRAVEAYRAALEPLLAPWTGHDLPGNVDDLRRLPAPMRNELGEATWECLGRIERAACSPKRDWIDGFVRACDSSQVETRPRRERLRAVMLLRTHRRFSALLFGVASFAAALLWVPAVTGLIGWGMEAFWSIVLKVPALVLTACLAGLLRARMGWLALILLGLIAAGVPAAISMTVEQSAKQAETNSQKPGESEGTVSPPPEDSGLKWKTPARKLLMFWCLFLILCTISGAQNLHGVSWLRSLGLAALVAVVFLGLGAVGLALTADETHDGPLAEDPGKEPEYSDKQSVDPGKQSVDPGKQSVDPGKQSVDPGKAAKKVRELAPAALSRAVMASSTYLLVLLLTQVPWIIRPGGKSRSPRPARA